MPLKRAPGRLLSLVILAAVYAAAIGVGALVTWKLPGPVPIRLMVAALASALTVFSGSFALDNSSVFDPYWSVAPPLLLGAGMFMEEATHRGWLLLAVLTLWSLRLTVNSLRGWPGLEQEDWRYAELRHKTGRAYWIVSLVGLHLFPTCMILLGMLGATHVLDSHVPIGTLDLVGAAIIVVGTVVEFVADEQIRTFKRTADPGAICDHGLWAWSRHPNYLGEILVWCGVWVVGVGAERWSWHWTLLGPAAMVLLFIGISIPMQERRAARIRSGWQRYVERTGMLLPAPWK